MSQKLIGYISLFSVIVLLDQGLKYVLAGWGTITKNQGIVLGLFPSLSVYLVALGVAFLALLVLKNKFSSASAFLLGGATSNLIDRLQFGYVVDYIDVGSLPVFNIADLAIIIGVGLLIKD